MYGPNGSGKSLIIKSLIGEISGQGSKIINDSISLYV